MTWQAAAVQHALEQMPREACGLVVLVDGVELYRPCRNMAAAADHFIMDPSDYADAAMAGEILAVVHSHPHAPATPSDADIQACRATALPWHIVSVPRVAWERLEPNAGIIEP